MRQPGGRSETAKALPGHKRARLAQLLDLIIESPVPVRDNIGRSSYSNRKSPTCFRVIGIMLETF